MAVDFGQDVANFSTGIRRSLEHIEKHAASAQERIRALEAGLKEALDSMAEAVEVLTDEDMLNTADRFKAQIAELGKLLP